MIERNQIHQLPELPGVYLMKDARGAVLYIGKAKNLRRRVRQYFSGLDKRAMVPLLLDKVVGVETLVVHSEKEALLLENNLIKQHQPHYNVLLKDDKTYIAIHISKKDPWPALRVIRYRGSPEKDGWYFGPYPSAFAARQMLDLLHRIFPLRKCSDQEFASRKRPCLLYQLKRCIAPCVGLCSREEYGQLVQQSVSFLQGKSQDLVNRLKGEMERHSQALEFEQAGLIRDRLRQIEKTQEEQYVDRPLGCHGDVIGFYREEGEAVVVKLLFREGRLVGSCQFDFSHVVEEDEEVLTSFLLQHYLPQKELPKEVWLPCDLSPLSLLQELFLAETGNKILFHHPKKGEKKELVEMAQTNAKAFFTSIKDKQLLRERTLLELKSLLHLSNYPAKIECIDTSHLSGKDAVAVAISFVDGQKSSKLYRTYRLHVSSGDDLASLREVVLRRYRSAQQEGKIPDLLLVDGGKIHLKTAKEALNELNVVGVDVVAIAKEEGRHDRGLSAEKLFLFGAEEPVTLPTHSPTLFFLQSVRDEAHRFALAFQKKRRTKNLVISQLDAIPGIGVRKKTALLRRFGSVAGILAASDEELLKTPTIGKKDVASIRQFFTGDLSHVLPHAPP